MENNTKRYLLDAERKIRLTQYDRRRLYYALLKEEGLQEKQEECRMRLSEYCEKLTKKYIMGEELCSIYPGCKRLCNTVSSFVIVYHADFDIDIPDFDIDTDRMLPPEDFVPINFSESLPDLFNEGSSWYRRNQSFYKETRFAPRIKKVAKKEEINTLKNLIHEYINAEIEVKGFLRDTKTKSKSRYTRDLEPFGKFYNLGALYDYNSEFGLRMKYEILNIVDPEPIEENPHTFDKHPGEFTTEQNIERLKQILKI